MCPSCFYSGFASFPSYWEFEAFEAELHQKLVHRQLLPLPRILTQGLAVMAPEQLYQCPNCGETWALSSPDNAWRGYFLPLAVANAYNSKLIVKGRIKRLAGVAVAIGAGSFILWQILK
ncbi:hypothetical protein KB206_06180 [Microvirga sp. STS02]|uniref:hypothetical protein n=1 Tax=Hymenobacter negativus TaxID=2795026 RepID=UPI0018DC2043|nr:MULTISPECIES: hypothetical protein [Bacteria]MBH8568459.1 hypothetical protein [Hymenobacter negativus]MBR7208194.1 hypothetical protein [Microvirga sp. STS02]